jgi:N-acetylmuramoyl-L-alanine amidase
MPERYAVVAGDCLSSIAEDFGFADYRSIYDDPINADFRALRPNPNLIHPGDVIQIPDKEGKFDNKGTGATHQFTVRTTKRFLRLRMLNSEGAKLADADYTLNVDGEERKGTTDADGFLREAISRRARKASMQIGGANWTLNIGHLNPIDQAPDAGILGVQQRLANLGYQPGAIDGTDGPKTQAAVRAFQEGNPPLAVDGICGPKTQARLVDVHGC